MSREYEAYLIARDLSERLLMAYGDKLRGVPSDYYMREAKAALRELTAMVEACE